MIFRKNTKNGDELSQLGFGCMRFPKKGNTIDMELSKELVKSAIEQGVNYLDTAYIYPGIEQALGTILKEEGLRDKVKIATKLPIFMCKTNADLDKLFNKQLIRLQTNRIDYYLLHMLSDTMTWERLKSLGIEKWISKQKELGRIKNLGFSYHGGRKEFTALIDSYDWDFCMIQYNYFDESNQAGREGLNYASAKGIPVFIMEPLRGGLLVNGLSTEAKNAFEKIAPKRTLADWGFRWLFNQPEVTMVLSGMNALSQVTENIQLGGNLSVECLTESETAAYEQVCQIMRKSVKVSCTGCGYCLPCPAGVDIPTCFSCYNEIYTTKYITAFKHYFMTTGTMTPKPSYASKCIECGKCETHCPQGIEIRKKLKDARRKLEPFWYRPVRVILRKILKIK